MAGLLVSGVLLATVHHILYHALDGKTARSGENIWDIQDQAWSIRFGTAIALLAKTWLAGAVTMAYQQQIWMNFRCADYTVGGIGSMLAALGDCFSFFNWELLARAKIAMGLALVVWLLPLSALISSSTLTVIAHTSYPSREQFVPTLDFTKDLSVHYRGSHQIAPVLEWLTVSTGANTNLFPMQNPIPNSSYRVDFLGPSVRCRTPGGEDRVSAKNSGIYAPLSVPEMIETIYNVTSDYFQKAFDAASTSTPGSGHLIYAAGSPFQLSEAILWRNQSKSSAIAGFVRDCVVGTKDCEIMRDVVYKDALWIRHNNQNIACALHETRYYAQFRSINTTQEVSLEAYELLGAIDDPVASYRTITQSLVNLLTGALGLCLAAETEGEVSPGSIIHLSSQTFLRSLRTRIRSTLLIGALKFTEGIALPDGPPPSTLDDGTYTQDLVLGALIEDFSRNLTMNLFSSSHFLNETDYVTNVTFVSNENIYRYARRNLLISYSVAFAATLFGVLVGMRALILNGNAHSTRFAAIIATTRSPSLAALTEGASMGSEPMPKEMLQTKLRFGILGADSQGNEETEVRRMGFGLAGQVKKLVKVDHYV
ncbi:MAG: hypothetical protein LQ337_007156 [Flavoplaca oasis]|nr:MAG: hypothetical protein LQ337_007156 [Flavoplaca oasis]